MHTADWVTGSDDLMGENISGEGSASWNAPRDLASTSPCETFQI